MLDASALDLLTLKNGSKVTAENWLARREEIRNLLTDEMYGRLPDLSYTLKSEMPHEENPHFLGDKAILRQIRLTIETEHESNHFDAVLTLPKSSSPVPVFVMAAFERFVPVDMIPVEEIVDQGFGLCTFVCAQVSADDGNFTSGLAKAFYPDGQRQAHDGGKIALWAWAASRVADVLLTMPEVDPQRLMVVGHSRMGKTALWAGAMDARFAGVISVQSGCGGAALSRENNGETIKDITTKFPYWFAPSFAQYADHESDMPFDQHFLLALIAPRKLYVTSAAGDEWACPRNEYLSCLEASRVYELLGQKPVEVSKISSDDMLLHGGDIGYSRRPGTHFFSRLDWQRICAFMHGKLS